MALDHMIQEHNLGGKFHRSTVSQTKISQEYRIRNIGRGDGRLSSSVTEVVAIPSDSVISFPATSVLVFGRYHIDALLIKSMFLAWFCPGGAP